ncbi:MAG: translocation/assembly module TamB domain-containing protein, partial [Prevotella sp.]|nr:translocation/assembly module TamB domain-containing protein [Prevotella sp.]
VRLTLYSDDTQLRFNGQVRNNQKNPQYVFNTLFNGYLQEKGATLNLRYYDQKDVLGVRLGAVAEMEDNGIRMRLLTDDPIIGYKKFNINKDNYVFLGDDKRVSAQLRMRSDDGVDVQVYSDDSNTDALQDLTLSLHKLKIEDIVAVIPYMPRMSGTLDGDYHFIQTPDDITVGSTMSVKDMTYEGSHMGNLGTEFVYMPKDDGSHYVDAIIYSDEQEVATVVGTYRSEGDGYLDAKLSMDQMPINVLNGLIPDQIVGFEGTANGDLDMRGQLSKPHVDGTLTLNNAFLVSEPYGMRMRFDTTPIQVKGSLIQFKDFNLYSTNDHPMRINGDVNFADLDNINLNIRLSAQDFLLIDSKEQRRSEAYGKAYVNLRGVLRGTLDYLRLRGRMDVLGTTDMSYILRDSPLTTDYQMEELVRFTDFTDTTQVVVRQPEGMGFDMNLTVNVDRAARIVC